MVASHVAPTGDLACNPGMCPDWESNWRPFGLQAGAQPLSHTSQGKPRIFNPEMHHTYYSVICYYKCMPYVLEVKDTIRMIRQEIKHIFKNVLVEIKKYLNKKYSPGLCSSVD